MRSSYPLIAAALIAAGLAGPAVARHQDPADVLADALKGRVAGKPVDCIDLPRTGGSQIIDGTAIVYNVGSTLYVNRPNGADSLRSDDVLVTKTFGSQLCRMDSVRLFDSASRMQRGFVSLNEFVPYKRAS